MTAKAKAKAKWVGVGVGGEGGDRKEIVAREGIEMQMRRNVDYFFLKRDEARKRFRRKRTEVLMKKNRNTKGM